MATNPPKKTPANSKRKIVTTGYKPDINIDALFKELSVNDKEGIDNKQPKSGLDDEITRIYRQAKEHRDTLVSFYIWYTSVMSAVVVILIGAQAAVRIIDASRHDLEIVPQWALNLLVVGMFGQFIGLLTIVTNKVWTFEPFLKHANHFKDHDE